MQLNHYKLSDINPAKYNPRKITDKELSGLTESIKKFGFIDPVIVNIRDGKNILVGGHQRLRVAEILKMETIPVVEVDLSVSEEKALNVALNSPTLSGKYDEEILSGLLDEIKVELPDLFEDLNFGDFDIEVEVEKIEGKTDDDSVPELRPDPITKPGDVWLLGNHRLMCGNSTMIDDVEKLMNGEKADISFTSPPYNAGDEVEIGTKGHKYESHDDAMSEDSYLSLLNDFTTNSLMFSDMSIVNIQQLAGNKIELIEYLHNFRYNFVDVAIWNKTHGTPSLPRRVMNCAFEYIYFFSNEDKPPRTIKTAPDFHGRIQNVYDGSKQTKNEFSKIHRATFPVHLPEFVVENFSTGSVLDLFNGTGTTLIACEKLSRKCFAMDMDPLYIDVTVTRWEEFTGKKAVLENGNI